MEFLCKYLLPVLSVFELPPKLRVVHIRKKFKISIFSKMALTILFKFCGFIVHSKPNNTTLSAFPGKIPETRKTVLIVCPSAKITPKPTDQSCSNRYMESLCKYLLPVLSVFELSPKLRVVHI